MIYFESSGMQNVKSVNQDPTCTLLQSL